MRSLPVLNSGDGVTYTATVVLFFLGKNAMERFDNYAAPDIALLMLALLLGVTCSGGMANRTLQAATILTMGSLAFMPATLMDGGVLAYGGIIGMASLATLVVFMLRHSDEWYLKKNSDFAAALEAREQLRKIIERRHMPTYAKEAQRLLKKFDNSFYGQECHYHSTMGEIEAFLISYNAARKLRLPE